ncbi:MAG: ABC transporter permease [Bacteriovorax sp.]|jgi:hypothetical protein
MFLTIAVIYYASESFNLKGSTLYEGFSSLFSFLLVGEIALVIPMNFAERLISHFLEIRNQQFYQTLIGLRISTNKFIFSEALVDVIFPFSRVLFILFYSSIFLNFSLTFTSVVTFILVQIFAVIVFAMMALIATLIYLKFNRGLSLFYSFQSVAAIIGGAYFPIQVFPTYLKNISIFLPQTQVLHASRLILNGQLLEFSSLATLFIWLIFLTLIWFFLNYYLIQNLKRNARLI